MSHPIYEIIYGYLVKCFRSKKRNAGSECRVMMTVFVSRKARKAKSIWSSSGSRTEIIKNLEIRG